MNTAKDSSTPSFARPGRFTGAKAPIFGLASGINNKNHPILESENCRTDTPLNGLISFQITPGGPSRTHDSSSFLINNTSFPSKNVDTCAERGDAQSLEGTKDNYAISVASQPTITPTLPLKSMSFVKQQVEVDKGESDAHNHPLLSLARDDHTCNLHRKNLCLESKASDTASKNTGVLNTAVVTAEEVQTAEQPCSSTTTQQTSPEAGTLDDTEVSMRKEPACIDNDDFEAKSLLRAANTITIPTTAQEDKHHVDNGDSDLVVVQNDKKDVAEDYRKEATALVTPMSTDTVSRYGAASPDLEHGSKCISQPEARLQAGSPHKPAPMDDEFQYNTPIITSSAEASVIVPTGGADTVAAAHELSVQKCSSPDSASQSYDRTLPRPSDEQPYVEHSKYVDKTTTPDALLTNSWDNLPQEKGQDAALGQVAPLSVGCEVPPSMQNLSVQSVPSRSVVSNTVDAIEEDNGPHSVPLSDESLPYTSKPVRAPVNVDCDAMQIDSIENLNPDVDCGAMQTDSSEQIDSSEKLHPKGNNDPASVALSVSLQNKSPQDISNMDKNKKQKSLGNYLEGAVDPKAFFVQSSPEDSQREEIPINNAIVIPTDRVADQTQDTKIVDSAVISQMEFDQNQKLIDSIKEKQRSTYLQLLDLNAYVSTLSSRVVLLLFKYYKYEPLQSEYKDTLKTSQSEAQDTPSI